LRALSCIGNLMISNRLFGERWKPISQIHIYLGKMKMISNRFLLGLAPLTNWTVNLGDLVKFKLNNKYKLI
jgi:hypothetical protein